MISSTFASDVAARRRTFAPLVTREGGRTVIWLDGEYDIATVLTVADSLSTAISVDDNDVVVDLGGVTFISTATIDVLIRGQRSLKARDRRLTLRSPSRRASRVLELCGLTDLVEPG
jgi:anti-anti-sigma factor